jgi:hypothetical protein
MFEENQTKKRSKIEERKGLLILTGDIWRKREKGEKK